MRLHSMLFAVAFVFAAAPAARASDDFSAGAGCLACIENGIAFAMRFNFYDAHQKFDFGLGNSYAGINFSPQRLWRPSPNVPVGKVMRPFTLHFGFLPVWAGPVAFGAGLTFDALEVGVPDVADHQNRGAAGFEFVIPFKVRPIEGVASYIVQATNGGQGDRANRRAAQLEVVYDLFIHDSFHIWFDTEVRYEDYGIVTNADRATGWNWLAGLMFLPFR